MRRTLFILSALLVLSGCGSPQQRAGTANRETKVETQKVATQVAKGQQANAAADQKTIALINDPATPEPVRTQLKQIHEDHKNAEAALKPIAPEILPKINDAADRLLQAELDAQDAENVRTKLIIGGAVFGLVFIGMIVAKCGIALSGFVAGCAALLLEVVVGIVSRLLDTWLPIVIAIAAVALVVYLVEVKFRGSWGAAIHAWFDKAKADAKRLPSDLADVRERLSAIENAVSNPNGSGKAV